MGSTPTSGTTMTFRSHVFPGDSSSRIKLCKGERNFQTRRQSAEIICKDAWVDINGAKLFVFDLDGTLVDSFDDIAAAVNYALTSLGLPRRSEKDVRQFVGNGIFQLMGTLLDSTPERASIESGSPVLEKAVSLWKEYYMAHPADRSRLYPGVVELSNYLKDKGIKRAVLSNKAHEVVLAVLKALGVSSLFDHVLGDGGGARRKPSPEGMLYLMEKFGAKAGETWLVGDGEADVAAGLAAGCRVCGVTHGILDRKTLLCLGAHHVVDSLKELMGDG